MMVKIKFCGALFLLICAGCASQTKNFENLSNLAPRSMTPPSEDLKNPNLDPVYLRSQADYHFTLGEALSLDGKSTEAIEEFKLATIYDPKAAGIHLRLAGEYAKTQAMTESLEQAEIAVEIEPDTLRTHLALGEIYCTLKIYEKALVQYTEALRIDPDNTSAKVLKAAVLAEQKRYDEAIAIFKELSNQKDNPERAQAFLFEGKVYEQMGKLKDAEAAFRKALSIKPGLDVAILDLAANLKDQNKIEAMIKVLRDFEDHYGPNHDVAQELASYYLEKEDIDHALVELEVVDNLEHDNLTLKLKIALLLVERKEYPRAVVLLEDIIVQAPESDKIRFYLGAVYEEIQQTNKALDHFKLVPSNSQFYPDAIIHSASIIKKTDLRLARKVVEKALSERHDQPQLYAFYAAILDEQKESSTAFNMLTSATIQFPLNPQLHFYLGLMADRLDKADKCIDEMNTVLKLEPEHVQALNFLAYTYAQQGHELDKAEQLAEKALTLQPHDPFILDTIGWIHFKKGEFDQSLKFLEEAANVGPQESIIAEHLGDVYYRLQLVDKAKSMYRRAVETEKDEKKLQEIRSKLAAVDHQVVDTTLREPASH